MSYIDLHFALVYAILNSCYFKYAQPYTRMFYLNQLNTARQGHDDLR